MKKEQRKEREYHARRAAILGEAEKFFSERGFYNVTVAEIANAAGFSTGFLYQFFESKEHLYTTMIIEKLAMMYEAIAREVEAAKNPESKIGALVEAQLRFVEENTDFCRIFIRGENELSPQTMNSMREQLKKDYFNHLSFVEKYNKVLHQERAPSQSPVA